MSKRAMRRGRISYDQMPNALIRAEQPLVDEALADIRAGRALDAACGTGRHAARLVASGHQTVGVDRSEAMLAIARRKVPQADFRIGDLTRLLLEDGSVNVAVWYALSSARSGQVTPRPATCQAY